MCTLTGGELGSFRKHSLQVWSRSEDKSGEEEDSEDSGEEEEVDEEEKNALMRRVRCA